VLTAPASMRYSARPISLASGRPEGGAGPFTPRSTRATGASHSARISSSDVCPVRSMTLLSGPMIFAEASSGSFAPAQPRDLSPWLR